MSEVKDFDYDAVFNAFYTPIVSIHLLQEKTTTIFPDETIQEQKIIELSKIPSAFGLIVHTAQDEIVPIPGIPFPFYASSLNNKQFCKYIHPNYLIPFLIYARFAYEIAMSVQVSQEEVLSANYRIPIPLKLPGKQQYSWFIQKGYVLSINQNHQIISHLNLYDFDRICLTLANGEIEKRFMEASILFNNNLHDVFQQYLKVKVNEYLHNLFIQQYKQWKILELLKKDLKQSNQTLAASLRLTEETIKSYSKDILQKLKLNLGYQFVSVREAVVSLTNQGYI